MKCFPLMFFVFFLMKVYVVFSVRQENQQFNLSMMENPNMNTIYKLLQQNQPQNISPVSPFFQNNNNINFDQFIKFYQLMNAFNLNNNNIPSYPNNPNPNYMLLSQLNNQPTQPQIDTNSLLRNLMSQLQPKQQSTESLVENQLAPVLLKPKNNLRKKEESQPMFKETPKSEDNVSDKIKENLKKLQELTKEANKIMSNKLSNKDENNNQDLFNSPDFMIKQRMNNGPVKEKESEVNDNIKNLQESIKILPESKVQNLNTRDNEITMPSMNTITNSFQNLSELKSQIKIDEEDHRKEEFEDRLNYLLSKLDVISKISDK